MIDYKELETKEAQAKEYQKAINRASSLIDDARARYVKEKAQAEEEYKRVERERNEAYERLVKGVDA